MTYPKVSIIMPVYNAASTIERIVENVISQTFTNWELIAVNDGSTDNSGDILDYYATNDSRIKVIHKANGGVASARQIGLNACVGNYIIHVDSDDLIDRTMLELMVAEAISTECDIIICDYITINKSTKVYHRQYLEKDERDAFTYNLLTGKIMGALWNKLIKTSLIRECEARFIDNIDYCEDQLFLINLSTKRTPSISFVNKALYFYIENPNSITRKITIHTYNSIEKYIVQLKLLITPDEQFKDIVDALSIGLFQAGIKGNLFDHDTIYNQFNKIKPFLYLEKSRRWKFAYILIRLRLICLIKYIVK